MSMTAQVLHASLPSLPPLEITLEFEFAGNSWGLIMLGDWVHGLTLGVRTWTLGGCSLYWGKPVIYNLFLVYSARLIGLLQSD